MAVEQWQKRGRKAAERANGRKTPEIQQINGRV